MREDYNYIDQATAICLYVLPKGLKHLETYLESNEFHDINIKMNPLEDLLAFIEDNYVDIGDRAGIDEDIAGLDEMFEALVYTYSESFNFKIPNPKEYKAAFVKAFIDNMIGVRKVIWG